MKCEMCGTQNSENAQYCASCGMQFTSKMQSENETFEYVEYQLVENDNQSNTSNEEFNDKGPIRCPRCGHTSIHFITRDKGEDFNVTNGICGFLLFGPLGLLCGLITDKETETTRKCMNCKHEF